MPVWPCQLGERPPPTQTGLCRSCQELTPPQEPSTNNGRGLIGQSDLRQDHQQTRLRKDTSWPRKRPGCDTKEKKQVTKQLCMVATPPDTQATVKKVWTELRQHGIFGWRNSGHREGGVRFCFSTLVIFCRMSTHHFPKQSMSHRH